MDDKIIDIIVKYIEGKYIRYDHTLKWYMFDDDIYIDTSRSYNMAVRLNTIVRDVLGIEISGDDVHRIISRLLYKYTDEYD